MSIIKTAQKDQLIGKTLPELEEYVQALGLEKFRAKQLFKWIYTKSIRDFEQMTDFSAKTRQQLADTENPKVLNIGSLKIKEKKISNDGTIKFLFELHDGQVVESVLMSFEDRDSYSACISSQVGCAVGCPFCATGTLGYKRNLSAAEIVEQVLFIQSETAKRITNIVYMGQGEPLHNYDSVVESVQNLRNLVGIGARHITLSTSGVVPQINRLADEGIQLTLALSLHEPTDEGRDYLVPINKKWPIQELMNSLKYYVDKTNRRVTIEYVLIRDLNDSAEKAEALGKLLKKLHCHINLIPYNSTDVKDQFKKPSKEVTRKFRDILTTASANKTVTIRQEKGADIAAACGQLANKFSGSL